MNIQRLPNGNLEMTADQNEQEWIKTLLDDPDYTMIVKESIFIDVQLDNDPMGDGVSYQQVYPGEVGALTDAPLISDGNNIYGYMDYAVSNFLDKLARGETITWQKG